MVERDCTSASADETRALGASLGAALPAGCVVLLEGQLGAGKTTFVQGIAVGMGIDARVISPSFTLVREYSGSRGRPALVHMDFYRLSGDADVRDLAIDDFLDSGAVLAIEWPDRAEALGADDIVTVSIELIGEERRCRFEAVGPAAAAALSRVRCPRDVRPGTAP